MALIDNEFELYSSKFMYFGALFWQAVKIGSIHKSIIFYVINKI